MLKHLLISNKLLMFVVLLPMGKWGTDDIVNGNFLYKHLKLVHFCIPLPSFPAERPSGLVMPVLFFRLCFLRLAWGDGGGSSLGLVALLMPGAELRGSDIPLAGGKKTDIQFNQRWQNLKSLQSNFFFFLTGQIVSTLYKICIIFHI